MRGLDGGENEEDTGTGSEFCGENEGPEESAIREGGEAVSLGTMAPKGSACFYM